MEGGSCQDLSRNLTPYPALLLGPGRSALQLAKGNTLPSIQPVSDRTYQVRIVYHPPPPSCFPESSIDELPTPSLVCIAPDRSHHPHVSISMDTFRRGHCTLLPWWRTTTDQFSCAGRLCAPTMPSDHSLFPHEHSTTPPLSKPPALLHLLRNPGYSSVTAPFLDLTSCLVSHSTPPLDRPQMPAPLFPARPLRQL